MIFKTYEINVDLVNDTSTTCSNRFSQNDRNSAKLLVTITNKGAELDLSQAKSVRMSFKKPDGTYVFQEDCQPINALKGKYQILLKTQTLAVVGNVIAQIHIEEEDRTIDTQKFFFVVNDSLSGNKAVESTNEFPVIQKAIEAGKKLEGVDINGIIAAGVKADAALPKAGGTMAGHLHFAEPYGVYFRDATNTAIATLYQNAGKLILRDIKNSSTLLDYDFATKLLNINAAGNVMKTTGLIRQLLPKTPSAGGIIYRDESTGINVAGLGYYRSSDVDKGMCYLGWGDQPWAQANSLSVGENVFKYKGKDIAFADKNGRATLTLSADGALISPNPIIADRRGNTVTVRAGIKRVSATSNVTLFTMPDTMRPLVTVQHGVISSDGTPATATIQANGDFSLQNAGSNIATNKEYFITLTYVVD
ncbi:BppU family phage baseplate upper protein [Bacillus paranthracis]|uniref:BppU family phage baseplate upper protein n=1 Tax=Bacillus paranthracis TaxID=2026186 RepID=UPI0035576FB9